MKRTILTTIICLFIAANSFAQSGTCGTGIVEYKGQQYEGCRATAFTYEDIIYIQINQPEKDYFTPFRLCIRLKLVDGKLPTGYFSTSESNSDNSLVFIRSYEDWSLANHTFQSKQANFYVQSFSDGFYNISGSLELDIEEKEVIDFMFWGQISYENIEVTKVTTFDTKDYSNNKGQLMVDEKTISTPVGFKDWLPNSQKIYILDRMIVLDQQLEYGVYFEFPHGEFPVGTFKTDSVSQPFKAAFFNKYKTEYPSETELTIKWNKRKQEYDINYSMNFANGQVVKGSYAGKIPESSF